MGEEELRAYYRLFTGLWKTFLEHCGDGKGYDRAAVHAELMGYIDKDAEDVIFMAELIATVEGKLEALGKGVRRETPILLIRDGFLARATGSWSECLDSMEKETGKARREAGEAADG